MDPHHDPDDPEASLVYVSGEPYRCYACTAIKRAQKSFSDSLIDEHKDAIEGLKWGVSLAYRKVRLPS